MMTTMCWIGVAESGPEGMTEEPEDEGTKLEQEVQLIAKGICASRTILQETRHSISFPLGAGLSKKMLPWIERGASDASH